MTDVELYVETCPYPQTIECPACGQPETLYIVTEKMGGYRCRGCLADVTFRHSRESAAPREDETEQVTLTDGGNERLVCQWTSRPFTSVKKRHIRVEHRIILESLPQAGVDVRHEIKCPERDVPEWQPAEVYECREYGIQRVGSDNRWWSS